MLADTYISILQRKTGVPLLSTDAPDEFQALYDKEFVSFLMEEASYKHNGLPFNSNLDKLPFVYVLAQAEVYSVLASAYAKAYSIGSKSGTLKKSDIFEHYLKLVRETKATYEQLKSSGETIVFTPVLINSSRNRDVRNHRLSPSPLFNVSQKSSKLLAATYTVDLLFSPTDECKYHMYISAAPIFDPTSIEQFKPDVLPTKTFKLPQDNVVSVELPHSADPTYLTFVAENKYDKQYAYYIEVRQPL